MSLYNNGGASKVWVYEFGGKTSTRSHNCDKDKCRKRARYVAWWDMSGNAVYSPHAYDNQFYAYICEEHLLWLRLQEDFNVGVPW